MDQPKDYRLRVAGEILAELGRARLQIKDLAAGTGIHVVNLSRRLNGHYPFDTDQLAAIAEFLEVPPARFLPDIVPASAGVGAA